MSWDFQVTKISDRKYLIRTFSVRTKMMVRGEEKNENKLEVDLENKK